MVRTRGALLAFVVALSASGCGASPEFRVVNNTAGQVTLLSCAGDDNMNRHLKAGAVFKFNTDIGSRTNPDDPGFACVLSRAGRLACLHIPTDQSSRSGFRVTDSAPVSSAVACLASSDPHL